MRRKTETPPEDDCTQRVCHDFDAWRKMNEANFEKSSKGAKTSSSSNNDTSEEARPSCPLDTAELGRNTWSFLHTMAAYYPEKPSTSEQRDMKNFIELFSKFYPCQPCARELRRDLKDMPPNLSSNEEFSQWMCRLHNSVNER